MALSFLKNFMGKDSKAAAFACLSVFIVVALYYNQNSFLGALKPRLTT